MRSAKTGWGALDAASDFKRLQATFRCGVLWVEEIFYKLAEILGIFNENLGYEYSKVCDRFGYDGFVGSFG